MKLSREQIKHGYETACRSEIEALKPGNVHVFADGHRMSASQFLASARVSSGPLTDPSLTVGERILAAVRATRSVVGTNTNLGIVLLAAPLARAAEIGGSNFRADVERVLDELTVADAAAAFAAIVHAAPAGLGSAEAHDVRRPAVASLREAMREAADRDRIARQYATGFADVCETGLEALRRSRARGESGMWPAVHVYLSFLAAFPDSHLVRKHGLETASNVRQDAASLVARLASTGSEAVRFSLLMEFDRRLKTSGLNPGTSADLTVASLFAQHLTDQLA